MQPRVPRLDWISQVLAEPAPRAGADRVPISRISGPAPATGQRVIRPEAFTMAARRRRQAAAKVPPLPKAGR
jgi:hypothetical protein